MPLKEIRAVVLLLSCVTGIVGCAANPGALLQSTTSSSSVATPSAHVTQVVGQGSNTNLATTIANAGNGGAVEVPQGYTETISSPILITESNLTITCDPDTALTLGSSIGAPQFPGTAQGMITLETGAGLSMDGCNLISTNNNNPAGIVGSLLVAQTGTTNLRLTNNTFTDCYYYCVFVIDVPQGYIHDNSFTGLRSDAIDLTGNSSNFTIDDNRCDTTGIAASPGHKCLDAHSTFGMITGTTSTSGTTITSVTNIADLADGDVLSGPALPSGTTVTGIGSSSITVSATPLVSGSGEIMTMSTIRQLSNLIVANNEMVTGTGFCIEIGDFGGAAPVNVVVDGNSCVAANLIADAPIATFTGTTTTGSTAVTVSSTTGIADNQNISGSGLAIGSVVTCVGATCNSNAGGITVSLPAAATESSVSMVTAAPSGGYSLQNVQGLSMDDNSYVNSTGFQATPGAIELVGDTSTAPYFVGQGPTSITGGSLIGGGISLNTVNNVTISGVYIEPEYGPYPGYYGAISISESNNVSISSSILDTRGVGPNKHSAVYDLCNKSIASCSNLSIDGVTALDDGQATDAAFHIGYASGTDMQNISITDGNVKGYTGPSAAAYYINSNPTVTNVKVEGMDDSGNTATFQSANSGLVPGPDDTQLYYAP